jgi:hypothetical protein
MPVMGVNLRATGPASSRLSGSHLVWSVHGIDDAGVRTLAKIEDAACGTEGRDGERKEELSPQV